VHWKRGIGEGKHGPETSRLRTEKVDADCGPGSFLDADFIPTHFLRMQMLGCARGTAGSDQKLLGQRLENQYFATGQPENDLKP